MNISYICSQIRLNLLKTNCQAIVYYNEKTGAYSGCCLRRVASNTNEQRSRSGLCVRVIHREATGDRRARLIKDLILILI